MMGREEEPGNADQVGGAPGGLLLGVKEPDVSHVRSPVHVLAA